MAIWRCDSTQNNKNMTSTLPIQKGITILCRVIPCTSSTVHLQERMKEIRVQLIIEGVLLFGLNLILLTALSTCTNPYFPWPSKGVQTIDIHFELVLLSSNLISIFDILSLWSFTTFFTMSDCP